MSKIKNLLFHKSSDSKKNIARNFFWLATSQTGSRLIKASVTLYAARVLGAAGYGILSYALALSGFFAFFKNIGVDPILTREIAKKPENESSLVATSFWIEFFLLLITVVLVIFIAPFFSGIKEAVALLPLIAIILVFDDLRDMIVAYFRGREEMHLEAIVVIVGNLAITGFGFAILLLRPTPFNYTIAYAISSILGWAVAVSLLKRRISNFLKHFKKELILPILKSAWPIAICGAVGAFFFSVDTVMLGWWRGAAEVGLYAADQKLVGILGLFPALFGIAVFPLISRGTAKDESHQRKIMEDSLSVLFLVAIPLTIGGWIVGKALVPFVFGSGYVSAIPAFFILLPTLLATYPPTILSSFIFAHDKQVGIVPLVITATAVNIVLNYFLIQKYGLNGAAAATLVANFVYALLLWRHVESIIGKRITANIKKKIISGAIMGAGVFIINILRPQVLISVFLGAVIYLSALYMLKDETLKKFTSLLNLSKIS